jgi:hypothetical protein
VCSPPPENQRRSHSSAVRINGLVMVIANASRFVGLKSHEETTVP